MDGETEPVGGIAGLFTWLVKLLGVAIAFNEAFLEDPSESSAFFLAGFMMAGAQGIDLLVDRVTQRNGSNGSGGNGGKA